MFTVAGILSVKRDKTGQTFTYIYQSNPLIMEAMIESIEEFFFFFWPTIEEELRHQYLLAYSSTKPTS